MKELELTKDSIFSYLEILNSKLANIGKEGTILLTGGASLCILFDEYRRSTRDIDALFEPSTEFHKIIIEISEEHDLPKDWLNDGVKGFLSDKLETLQILKLSHLSIQSIDAKSLLAMKLGAARTENSKDLDDCVYLMKELNISSVDELFELVEERVPKRFQTIACNYFVYEAFQKYQDAKSASEFSKKADKDIKHL